MAGDAPTAVVRASGGRRLVTGDRAGALRAWDYETGLLLRTVSALEAGSEGAEEVRLLFETHDARAIASVCGGVYAEWDPGTLERRRSAVLPKDLVVLARGERPGWLFAHSSEGLVELDAWTGAVTRRLPLSGAPWEVGPTLTVSRDGRRLFVSEFRLVRAPRADGGTTTREDRLTEVELASGRVLRTTPLDGPFPALSPDERAVASGRYAVTIREVGSGRKLAETARGLLPTGLHWVGDRLVYCERDRLGLIDVERAARPGFTAPIHARADTSCRLFDAGDDRSLIAAGARVEVWALGGPGLTRVKRFAGQVRPLSLAGDPSPDAIFLWAPGQDADGPSGSDGLRLRWDLVTGGIERKAAWPATARVRPPQKVEVRRRTGAIEDLQIFDRATGRRLLELRGPPPGAPDHALWTPKVVLLPGEERVAVKAGTEISTHDLRTGAKLVLSSKADYGAWQVAEDRRHAVIAELATHRADAPSQAAEADSHLYDFAAGTTRPLGLRGALVTGVSSSPDGTRLALILTPADRRYASFSVTTYSLPSLARGATFSLPAGSRLDQPKVRWVSNELIATFGADDHVHLWAESGRVRGRLSGAAGPIEDLDPVAGERVVGTSRDGSVRLWSTDTGRWIGAAVSDDAWVVFTASGWFDGSRSAGTLLATVKDEAVTRVDQLAARNNRPDLLLAELGLGSPEVRAHFRARHERRLLRLGLTEEQLEGRLDAAPRSSIASLAVEGRQATLVAELSDPKGELAAYEVYVNGVSLDAPGGAAVRGARARIERSFPLLPGLNRVEVSARDAAGAESPRALREVVYEGKLAPRLLFVGFGVSKYRDARLDLDFAHKDALDLARAFAGLRGFAGVVSKTYVDRAATRASIQDAATFLRQSRPEDVVVVFLAGHGIHTRDAAADYYFLTHDTDVDRLAETAVSFDALEGMMAGVAARRRLWFIDTCESGEVDNAPGAPAAAPGGQGSAGLAVRGLKVNAARSRAARPWLHGRDRFIYNDLSRATGAVVFSSSRGAEVSMEDPALKNGLFTRALVQALTSPAADADRDGAVSKPELADYLSRLVGERSAGRQNPTVDRDNLDVELSFVLPR